MLQWAETHTMPDSKHNQPLMETTITTSTTTSTTHNSSHSHTEYTPKQQAFINQWMLRILAEQAKIFRTRIKAKETESKGSESKWAKQPSKMSAPLSLCCPTFLLVMSHVLNLITFQQQWPNFLTHDNYLFFGPTCVTLAGCCVVCCIMSCLTLFVYCQPKTWVFFFQLHFKQSASRCHSI